MSSPEFAKCNCQCCGGRIAFPPSSASITIQCPHCSEETALLLPEAAELSCDPPVAEAPLSRESLDARWENKRIRPRGASALYTLGLLIVAIATVLLPVIYMGLIVLAAWGVFYWATEFTFLLKLNTGIRGSFLKVLAYATPLFSGLVLVLFMIKPFFAKRQPRAQPLALNPEAEPLLFDLIARVCQAVDAPFPSRIDLNCELNASASFRRGFMSFLGNDLVLTIGLPLAAGLTVKQLAGVLAHEFGHFAQPFAMRLTYLIRTVNGWFARVVYERDSWDVTLEEWAQSEDWHVIIPVNIARFAVWVSRLVLKVLMYLGHGIGCFMLKQMEHDADHYEIQLVGSECFEATCRRFHVLGALLNPAYHQMRIGWNSNRRLPDNFPTFLLRQDSALTPEKRTSLEDRLGLQPSGLFDTHPSTGDRIRRARRANALGTFDLEAPATMLFSNFDAVSRQVTMLHYEDDLGIPFDPAQLTRVDDQPDSVERQEEAAVPSGRQTPIRIRG